MGHLAMAAQVLGTVVSTIGQIQKAKAQKAAGKAELVAAQHRASLLEATAASRRQEAGQQRAASQRNLIAERRKGAFVSSRARAVAGASGGATTDPTIVSILGDIDLESEYRASLALYEGEEAARGLERDAETDLAEARGEVYAGQVSRAAGRAAAMRTYLSAGAGILRSGSALYEKYATEPPPNTARRLFG